MARRRRLRIADARARHPPAPDLLRRGRIAHVEDLVALVVELVVRDEIGRARRHVHVLAVAEPELVHAARFLARAVHEGDRLRLLRHRDVEQLEAGRLLPRLLALVGDRHDVADHLERIRAHVALRQLGLHHDLRLARVGDIDRGEILRRALVREPDDAPSILGDLDRHALAHAAEAFELVMREELEIPFDLVGHNGSLRWGDQTSSSWPGLSRPSRLGWHGASLVGVAGRQAFAPVFDGLCPATTCGESYAPARAFSMKSGRSALPQSGIAAIFFSRSRISACSCM